MPEKNKVLPDADNIIANKEKEMADSCAEIGAELRKKAIEELKKVELNDMKPRELIGFLKDSVNIEKQGLAASDNDGGIKKGWLAEAVLNAYAYEEQGTEVEKNTTD